MVYVLQIIAIIPGLIKLFIARKQPSLTAKPFNCLATESKAKEQWNCWWSTPISFIALTTDSCTIPPPKKNLG